ncbi:MAG: hypothetical protein PHT44_01810 [Candidatus Portnoybacteria bacterium]|nr:hypothetical protein [Candidatus Portnoybacteria bacterium]MDD4982670.1 hypothetical protein [Candidatus Portnoybacteria bacterium]
MRHFEGHVDKSAIVLKDVFPGSDLVISSPFEFSGKRSGVYIEGAPEHVEIVFGKLTELLGAYIDEKMFGRWIAATPPEDDLPRAILHYEASANFEKMRLLNFVFREQLAKICNFHLSEISVLLVRAEGREIDKRWVALPAGFPNGSVRLPEIKKEETERNSFH